MLLRRGNPEGFHDLPPLATLCLLGLDEAYTLRAKDRRLNASGGFSPCESDTPHAPGRTDCHNRGGRAVSRPPPAAGNPSIIPAQRDRVAATLSKIFLKILPLVLSRTSEPPQTEIMAGDNDRAGPLPNWDIDISPAAPYAPLTDSKTRPPSERLGRRRRGNAVSIPEAVNS
ncbi:hypothetical protein EVAR_98123_1 [Eumeta japonica]|uniref:Uncharacterized protein n=1 Tax=Eumeta variegata TaxID=151549 RepID=A0A4C2ABE1_EUMVA|nr:hypothetical protein EVAR_98123_1 [Eumeta japonica]